jgi:hypothetical protein
MGRVLPPGVPPEPAASKELQEHIRRGRRAGRTDLV